MKERLQGGGTFGCSMCLSTAARHYHLLLLLTVCTIKSSHVRKRPSPGSTVSLTNGPNENNTNKLCEKRKVPEITPGLGTMARTATIARVRLLSRETGYYRGRQTIIAGGRLLSRDAGYYRERQAIPRETASYRGKTLFGEAAAIATICCVTTGKCCLVRSSEESGLCVDKPRQDHFCGR